jgi:transposase InsO family protein
VSFAVIQAEKAHYPVRMLCAVLGVSPSGYYAWQGRAPVTPRVRADRGVRLHLRAIHAANRSYGSPRLHAALRAAGTRIGRKRVIRLMQAEQLRGRPHRRFHVTTQVDRGAVYAPNRLQQQFQVAEPNRVWTSDITALPTGDGWLYLAVVLDLYSRRIVGWATRPTLATDLVVAAFEMAVARRRPAPGVVLHSDRGCQYTSETYQARLRRYGVVGSMSGTGNCFDNAPTESFFRTLKVEIADRCSWPTRRDAGAAVATFIEQYYNRTRLHSSLGYHSPLAFETATRAA